MGSATSEEGIVEVIERPITFEAPGPGEWMLDTTHHGRRPITGYLRPMVMEQFSAGMADLFEKYGLPLASMSASEVHGCFYVRPKAIGEGATPKAPPPKPILKVLTRLHPELRRRNRTAATAWAERRWREDVRNWFERDRDPTIRTLRRFQGVDLTSLNDAALVRHVSELTTYLEKAMRDSMAMHGGDLIPTGDFFAHCTRWGIDAGAAGALLRGSSPASSEADRLLEPVRAAIAAASARPSTVADIRALGPEAEAAVDAWLDRFAWRVIDSDDLDATTLAERPGLQLAALLAPARSLDLEEPPDASALRLRVPAGERELFDAVLAEARHGLTMRDDHVGVRWCWPVGLLRRALLEVGRRLQARGRLTAPEHALELDRSELGPALTEGHGPTASELHARWTRRFDVEAAEPPSTLGEPEGPPPLDVFPPAMARATAAVLAVIDAMQGEASPDPLSGVGVGDAPYVGTARVVSGADDAFDRLRDGDVLVAPFTGPAYNTILGIAGAVVVEEGGALCHAAIVARELGIPAVIGASAATREISDGSLIEVDPLAGMVRLV